MNINKITQENLCIQCGICSSICPIGCIEIGEDYFPKAGAECTDCGLCTKVCSAASLKEYNFSAPLFDYILGDIKEVLHVKSKDKEFLKTSGSGGAVTGIIKCLLESGKYDSAFLVEGYNYEKQLKSKRFTSQDDLESTKKSRYLTINYSDCADYMKTHPDEKIILVAVGCIFSSLENFINLTGLKRENYLFFGLICDKTMNYGVYDYFKQHPACKGKTIKNLYFKSKALSGWPGNVRIEFTDGTFADLPAKERMRVKDYFIPERCHYCLNKLNMKSDITAGDNYILNDSEGSSTLILRTDTGKEVWEAASGLFESSLANPSDLITSQHLERKFHCLAFAQIKGLISGMPEKRYLKEYKYLMKKIQLSKNKNLYNPINTAIIRHERFIKLKKFFRKMLKL